MAGAATAGAATAGLTTSGTGAGAGAGLGASWASGATLGSSTGGAGVATVGLSSGGSNRNVYSRTKRPADHESSTSKSMKGSFIGWLEMSAITYWLLGLRSIENLMLCRTPLYSTFAWRKVSTDASMAANVSASPGCNATTSISALSGCPSPDRTFSRPKPAASANDGKAKPTIAMQNFLKKVLPTLPPR